jgi:uncharacterized protein YdhG (YjbR/CyaY superfamily)
MARMKRSKRRNRRAGARRSTAAPRPKGAPATVDEYIARVPEPARSMIKRLRAAIRSAVPAQAREIISYRIPAFRDKRMLVWYAAFSNHCSLFPTSAVIGMFKDELKGFSTSKGTIQFPIDKPLPIALIKKIVKARAREANR